MAPEGASYRCPLHTIIPPLQSLHPRGTFQGKNCILHLKPDCIVTLSGPRSSHSALRLFRHCMQFPHFRGLSMTTSANHNSLEDISAFRSFRASAGRTFVRFAVFFFLKLRRETGMNLTKLALDTRGRQLSVPETAEPINYVAAISLCMRSAAACIQPAYMSAQRAMAAGRTCCNELPWLGIQDHHGSYRGSIPSRLSGQLQLQPIRDGRGRQAPAPRPEAICCGPLTVACVTCHMSRIYAQQILCGRVMDMQHVHAHTQAASILRSYRSVIITKAAQFARFKPVSKLKQAYLMHSCRDLYTAV